MDQEAVETAVSVLEGMNEDEGERRDRGRDHGLDPRIQQPARQAHPARHQVGNHLRSRADEMDLLAIAADRLANEVLKGAPSLRRIARIDDLALKADQGGGVAEIEGRGRA